MNNASDRYHADIYHLPSFDDPSAIFPGAASLIAVLSGQTAEAKASQALSTADIVLAHLRTLETEHACAFYL
jgi:hypothetical protein